MGLHSSFLAVAFGMHLVLEPVTKTVRHASTRLPQAMSTQRQTPCWHLVPCIYKCMGTVGMQLSSSSALCEVESMRACS